MAEAPRFYDIGNDEFRPVTKADLDMLSATANAYGKLRTAMQTVHEELMAEVKAIQSQQHRTGPAA